MSGGSLIIDAARSYVGTPWRHHGRNHGGLDCVGLIVCVIRDAGFGEIETGAYSKNTEQADMIKRFARYCMRVAPGEIALGDFPCFITGGRRHCGIYAGATIIHANFSKRFVVEQDWQDWLMSDQRVKLFAAFRMRSY